MTKNRDRAMDNVYDRAFSPVTDLENEGSRSVYQQSGSSSIGNQIVVPTSRDTLKTTFANIGNVPGLFNQYKQSRKDLKDLRGAAAGMLASMGRSPEVLMSLSPGERAMASILKEDYAGISENQAQKDLEMLKEKAPYLAQLSQNAATQERKLLEELTKGRTTTQDKESVNTSQTKTEGQASKSGKDGKPDYQGERAEEKAGKYVRDLFNDQLNYIGDMKDLDRLLAEFAKDELNVTGPISANLPIIFNQLFAKRNDKNFAVRFNQIRKSFVRALTKTLDKGALTRYDEKAAEEMLSGGWGYGVDDFISGVRRLQEKFQEKMRIEEKFFTDRQMKYYDRIKPDLNVSDLNIMGGKKVYDFQKDKKSGSSGRPPLSSGGRPTRPKKP